MPSSSGGGANSPQCTTHANEKTLMRMHAEGHGAVFPPFMGEIQLILGPMFSGKSTELLRRVRRFKYSKRKVLLLKYKVGSTVRRWRGIWIVTHDADPWVRRRILDIRNMPFPHTTRIKYPQLLSTPWKNAHRTGRVMMSSQSTRGNSSLIYRKPLTDLHVMAKL